MTLRQKTFQFLEISQPEDRASYWFDMFMVGLILSNVVAIILETVDVINVLFRGFFYWFELFSVIIFTFEYIIRVWSSVEDPSGRYSKALGGRIRYMLSPLALVDLIAFLPFYLTAFFGIDLRILRLVRLLRLMKLTRYSPAISIIGSVIASQHRALTAAFFVMLMALLFSSSLMFAFENQAQPEKFSSIPTAMWWGMATLTTVGYGDVAPITPIGQFLGIITMIIGIGMFALPTGVIATGFSNEIDKLNFVVNWKLVSSVPLFKNLDVSEIGEIATLLAPRTVPPNYAVIKLGDTAEGMFFIISGQLEVELTTKSVVLESGQFFGEMGVIDDSPRTATIVSLTECKLLELTADDLKHLMSKYPSIKSTVEKVIEERKDSLSQDFTTD
ncbi:MAG: cyclic nucleotide-gated ion channel [Pseudomonadota bacterium]|nr:cyclic nucleotide-gated ion channel [Pseudomonadota bacterium]